MHRTAARPLSRPFQGTFTKHTLTTAVLCALALAGCQRTTTLDESRAGTRVDAPRGKPQVADARSADTEVLAEAAPVAAAAAAREEVDKVVVTGSRLTRSQQQVAKRAVGNVSGGHAFAPASPPPPPAPMMIAPSEPMPMDGLANTEK